MTCGVLWTALGASFSAFVVRGVVNSFL